MAKKKLEEENRELRRVVMDLHWMARRYADGRCSYAASTFNEHTRSLLHLGIELNPTGDKTIWAKDGHGRSFDHLSKEEVTPGTDAALGK